MEITRRLQINSGRIEIFLLIISMNCAVGVCPIYGQQQLKSNIVQLERESKLVDAHKLIFQGKIESAIESLEPLQKELSQEAAIPFLIAQIHFKYNNDFDRAVPYIERALKLDPDNTEILSIAAYVYHNLPDPAKELEMNRRLSESEPNNFSHLERYCWGLTEMRRIDQAVELLNDFQQRNPDRVQPLISELEMRLYNGEGIKAIQKFMTQVEGRSEEEYLVEQALRVLKKSPNREKLTQPLYNRLSIINPNHRAAAKNQFNKGALNDRNLTIEDFRNPNVDLNRKIGWIVSRLTAESLPSPDTLKTLQQWSKALVEEYPKESKTMALSGDIAFLSGKYAEALKWYEAALEKEKSIYVIWEHAMESAYMSGNEVKLMKLANKSLLYFPEKFDGYWYLAWCQFNREEYSEALNSLSQLKLMCRNHPDWYPKTKSLEIIVLTHSDPTTNLQNDIKTLLKEFPNSPDAMATSQTLDKGSGRNVWHEVPWSFISRIHHFSLSNNCTSLIQLEKDIPKLMDSPAYNYYLRALEHCSTGESTSDTQKELLIKRGAFIP